jgi:hypothetical protein
MTTWDDRIALLEKKVDEWNRELDALKDLYNLADEKTKSKHQIDIISLDLKLEESIILLESLFSEDEQTWKKELKEKYNEGVSIMKERIEQAKDKFDDFDTTKDEVWRDLKEGVEKSTKSLGEAIDKVKSRFKD